MRVLVTGASGYVGGAIAAHLVQKGIEVVGLSRQAGVDVPSVDWAPFDISVPGVAEKIANQVQRCDVIVHAAASLAKDLSAAEISLVNCLGTQEMLKLASLWGSHHFIYISSIPVIGKPNQLPITEDHPVCPPSGYHASKLYGEHLVRLAETQSLKGTSLRLTAPIGPKMPGNRILSVFIRQALQGNAIQLAGRGTRRQDYVDVRDIASAVEKCLAARAAGTFLIASGRTVSNEELARKCVALLASTSRIGFNGKSDPEEGMVWEISIKRAHKCFGYEPQFSLEESIQALAAEYANSAHQ